MSENNLFDDQEFEPQEPEEETQEVEEPEEEPQDTISPDEEPEGESGDDADEQAQNAALIQFIKENFGEDLSSYGNDYEAIKSLIHARKLIGKREEDAAIARRLRERFGDDYLERLLSGEPSKPDTNPSMEEVQKQWQQALADMVEWNDEWLKEVYRDEEGKLVPAPGADKDVVDKIMRFVKHRDKIVNEFAKNPRRFFYHHLQEFLPVIKQIVLQDVQNIQKTQAVKQEAVNWVSQNANILFENGDPDAGLTPLGEEIIDLATTFMEAGMQDKEAAIRRAGEFILQRKQSEMKKQKPEIHATPPRRRAVPKSKPRTIAEIIEQDKVSISEALERYKKERGTS